MSLETELVFSGDLLRVRASSQHVRNTIKTRIDRTWSKASKSRHQVQKDFELEVGVAHGLTFASTENPYTPLEIHQLLANHSNADVRFALAKNRSINRKLLAALAEDENRNISEQALQTLSTIRLEGNELILWIADLGRAKSAGEKLAESKEKQQ